MTDKFVTFPLKENSKIPACRWQEENLPEVTGTNYGIHTGKSGLVVVDLDKGHDSGVDGVATFKALCPGGELPQTYTVSTPSGGLHLYFQAADGIGRHPNTWAGVDVLGGEGYVVGPGSVIDGKVYETTVDVDVPELPEWLLAKIKNKLGIREVREYSNGTGSAAYEKFISALAEAGMKTDGKNWQCPAHNDRTPSMSVTDAGDRALVHCFAGCDYQEICSAIGLDEADMFDGNDIELWTPLTFGNKAELAVVSDDDGNGWKPWNPEDWFTNGTQHIEKVCFVDDGFGLFYAGKTNTVIAESEAGKSWLGLRACADEINQGHDVAFIDFEDSGEEIYTRLLYMCDWDDVKEHFSYYRPETPIPSAFVEDQITGKALVVIDGYGEALTLHGLKQDDEGVLSFNRRVSRPMSLTGACVVHLDHFPKDKANQQNAFGSVYKKNTVSGASYFLRNKEAFGKDLKGYSVLEVAKDRPGQIRTECENDNGTFYAAELHIDSTGEEPVVRMKPVTTTNFIHKIDYCQRVSDYMWEAKTDTRTGIRDSVKGKNNEIATAIDDLVAQGCLMVDGKKITFVKHYKEPF